MKYLVLLFIFLFLGCSAPSSTTENTNNDTQQNKPSLAELLKNKTNVYSALIIENELNFCCNDLFQPILGDQSELFLQQFPNASIHTVSYLSKDTSTVTQFLFQNNYLITHLNEQKDSAIDVIAGRIKASSFKFDNNISLGMNKFDLLGRVFEIDTNLFNSIQTISLPENELEEQSIRYQFEENNLIEVSWTSDYDWGRTRVYLPQNIDTLQICIENTFQENLSLTSHFEFPCTQTRATQKAESIIKKLIEDQYQAFKKELKPSATPRNNSSPNSFFDTYLTDVYLDQNVLSIRYDIQYYHSGAAHPMYAFYSFNYDLKSNTQLGFKTVFSDDLDTEELLFLISDALQINIETYDLKRLDFNFTNTGVSFNFDAYELGPYAMGTPSGVVKWAQINSFLKERYQQ